MKEYIIDLANHVYEKVSNTTGVLKNRQVHGYSIGGDAQFNIDKVAEDSVLEFVKEKGQPMAVYTEDEGLIIFGKDPEYILIVDPIDGTRPMAAGLEMACVSIAVSKYFKHAKIKDVQYALVMELKTGAFIYGDVLSDKLIFQGYSVDLPNLSKTTELDNMFWTIEFNGHPANLMLASYGHLIDKSANNGGVFIFNSATYSISRIITGQLDAYVDIGNRILKDHPSLLEQFQSVGNGKVLHLFPYDIAAIVFLAKKAGVVITDAYGNSLDETLLMDLSYMNQQSCIAASNEELHKKLLDNIIWMHK
ncbi:MAG: hypothetical protein CVV02_12615 [Firmicutes bacterium HGW-Firmicutes-7]|nr:MAG: hypothetical protein CVV02_12615 [Firmicutes bacterium HGW-Firmicutes-7]